MKKEEKMLLDKARRQKLMEFISNSREAYETVGSICDALPDDYRMVLSESNYSNCPKIYEDIIELNSDPSSGPLIVVDNNRFRVATKEEATKYISKIQTKALELMKRYWRMYEKADLNGQLTVFEEEYVTLVKED